MRRVPGTLPGAADSSSLAHAFHDKVYGGVSAFLRERFLRSLGDVPRTQHRLLMKVLSENAATVFGRDHGFGHISSVEEYRSAVPLRSHEELDGLIRRVAAGEPGILTRAPVDYLQLTSGSMTGRRRMVPSTPVYRRERRAATLVGQGLFNRWADERGIRRGRGLAAVASLPLGYTEGGIPYGTASAGHARGVRRLWGWFSVTPYAATTVVEPEDRRYALWRHALLSRHISFVSAPFMAYLDTFATTLFRRSEELIRDVADGTLGSVPGLSRALREELAASLRPDRGRAAELQELADRHGGLVPRAVWPDIGWLLTAHGPVFQTYEPRLAGWYGQKGVWGTQYGASEGLVGVPYDGTYAHAPAVSTSFLEFIPEEYWTEEQPRTLLIEELRIGGRYEVVLTGWNGMYRYRLGDVVEVVGGLRGAPTFEVVSRRAGILSIAGEEMTEAAVSGAVAACARGSKTSFVDFVVDVDQTTDPARYRLWAEPSGRASVGLLRLAFDAGLCSSSATYGELRDRGEIGTPAVELLPRGTFYGFRRRREREGGPAEQLKILHSSTDPGYVAMFRYEAGRRGRAALCLGEALSMTSPERGDARGPA